MFESGRTQAPSCFSGVKFCSGSLITALSHKIQSLTMKWKNPFWWHSCICRQSKKPIYECKFILLSELYICQILNEKITLWWHGGVETLLKWVHEIMEGDTLKTVSIIIYFKQFTERHACGILFFPPPNQRLLSKAKLVLSLL